MTQVVEARITSQAKIASEVGAGVIGHNSHGGLFLINGIYKALKHPNFRFTYDLKHPWGHPDNGYTKSDYVDLHMWPELPPIERTNQLVWEQLEQLRNGMTPLSMTKGIEVEGTTYKKNTSILAPAYKDQSQNKHPELMDSTLETATGTDENGKYPNTPASLARQLARAILEAEEQAEREGNVVVYSSVPEGGNIHDNMNTQIPYLQAFAPRVLADTVNHKQNVPNETIRLYSALGIPDIFKYLLKTGNLNWPVQAIHVHNGVALNDGLADTRIAFAMAQVRNTALAKILSFMMYNTHYCYGVDVRTKDVRAIMRRLLSTTHGGPMPTSAEEYLHGAFLALENGEIHSPGRHPKEAQHGRTRIRMDGITMESIDAPMNPDLRLVLGWSLINQIMDVIALDALAQTQGNESQVTTLLEAQFGELMSIIPEMGTTNSSYAHDLVFNQAGFEGKAPWMQQTYKEAIQNCITIFEGYADRYPAIGIHVAIVKQILGNIVKQPQKQTLEEYFGVEKGFYMPNGKNHGIVTDAKHGYSVQELIDIQSMATRMQAEALSNVTNDVDLLSFFGIN